MPRVIEVSATPSVLDDALHKIKDIEGVVSIARQQGASLIPPGDVLSIHVATDASHDVLEVLHELDVAENGSILTSDVMSIVSPPHQKTLDRESDEAALDEMAFLLRRDANPSPNYLVSMFLAGAIAASGLWLDMLHLIIGAMVIAPAFEPLVRLPFGLVTGARELIPSGLMSIGAGFALLATGAAAVGVLFEAWGAGPATELGQRQWVRFWSTLSATGIVTSALGGMAGGVRCYQRPPVSTHHGCDDHSGADSKHGRCRLGDRGLGFRSRRARAVALEYGRSAGDGSECRHLRAETHVPARGPQRYQLVPAALLFETP